MTTQSPADANKSTVPHEGSTVLTRSRKELAEHSSKSVHLWSATSTRQHAHITCRHPASKIVEPLSCGNKYPMHDEVERRGTRSHTRGGLGWGGLRGRRVWHGTYARGLEAHLEGMRPQSGRGKGNEPQGEESEARGVGRQSGSMAVASGERRRRGRQQCTGRGWLRAGGERQPPPVRSCGEVA